MRQIGTDLLGTTNFVNKFRLIVACSVKLMQHLAKIFVGILRLPCLFLANEIITLG